MTGQPKRSTRDHAATAVFEGFFACGWFGWGQVAAPTWLRPLLGLGSGLAIAIAISALRKARRQPRSTSHLHQDRDAMRRYAILVGIEFATAAIGAIALETAGPARYVPVLVCAVVGAHFYPLAPVLRDRSLIALGTLLCAAAAAGLATGMSTHTAPSTVTGPLAGCALLIFALTALVRSLRTSADTTPPTIPRDTIPRDTEPAAQN